VSAGKNFHPSIAETAVGQLCLDWMSISLFVFVVVIIFLVFRGEVQLNRIEADDFKPGLTLFAMNDFSLIHVLIDVEFRFTLRTNC
jgi:hypothetical protein